MPGGVAGVRLLRRPLWPIVAGQVTVCAFNRRFSAGQATCRIGDGVRCLGLYYPKVCM